MNNQQGAVFSALMLQNIHYHNEHRWHFINFDSIDWLIGFACVLDDNKLFVV